MGRGGDTAGGLSDLPCQPKTLHQIPQHHAGQVNTHTHTHTGTCDFQLSLFFNFFFAAFSLYTVCVSVCVCMKQSGT